MNKMPLPLHLLAKIPGYAMLGQTSYGGYHKIISAWWLNDCPEVFEHAIEWCSLSGMYQRDYAKYKSKIEPLLVQSIDILKKYREDKRKKNEYRMANMQKAIVANNKRIAAIKAAATSTVSIVDKHTPVNPCFVKPDSQPFHEGWNLNKAAPASKAPRQQKAFLTDK